MSLEYSQSFTPIIGSQAHTLILGTLPGQESLRKQEYYGHPRNAFWPILFELFGESLTDNYNTKLAIAREHHIALWDVCHRAIRPGSLDVDIKKEQANPLHDLLERHRSINTIVFNGKKAQALYDKYFTRLPYISYHTLLSTSPANASFSYQEKLKDWSIIRK